jgi:hypothetical protein
VLTPAEATALFDGFASGALDAAEVLARPLVAVDAGPFRNSRAPTVPVAFPAVVVAVATAPRTPAPTAAWADVALTSDTVPPAPWVGVRDVAEALADLEARVTAHPVAATTLVGLLRAAPGGSTEAGLLIESLAYSVLQAGPEFASWRRAHPPVAVAPGVGPAVLVDRRGDDVTITLNRPQRHNAYGRSMRDGLCEALAVALADPACRVALAGAGPSFCSGGDLAEFATLADPASAHLVRTARSPARLIAALAGRVSVRIHGYCAGSGIELPAFAGEVRAHPDTVIWLPEMDMGLIPGAGGTVSLPARIGAARTAWMVLSGARIDAATALAWGLVDSVSGKGE